MKHLSTILLVGWLCVSPQAVAQSDSSADVMNELKVKSSEQQLKSLVENVLRENALLRERYALLRERLKAADSTGDTPIQESPDAIHSVPPERPPSGLETQISKLASQIDALRVERAIAQQLHVEQIESLRKELENLKSEEEQVVHSGDETMPVEPAAIQAMARRMAEAHVENRLRMLEAQAMVDAMKNRRAEVAKKCSEEAQLAIEKAALLVDQRRAEFRMLKDQSAATTQEARRGLELELEQADLRVRKAELMRDEAESRAGNVSRELDERLAEAVIELEVSETVEKALGKDMARTRRLQTAASDLGRIRSHKETLQLRLIQAKLAASDNESSRDADIRKLEAKLKVLTDKSERAGKGE